MKFWFTHELHHFAVPQLKFQTLNESNKKILQKWNYADCPNCRRLFRSSAWLHSTHTDRNKNTKHTRPYRKYDQRRAGALFNVVFIRKKSVAIRRMAMANCVHENRFTETKVPNDVNVYAGALERDRQLRCVITFHRMLVRATKRREDGKRDFGNYEFRIFIFSIECTRCSFT